jgi:SAM-dependent methyltransferase
MKAIGIHNAYTDIKIHVGCGATPTPGWVNFDDSVSIRMARYPGISSVLARLRLIDPQSASLAATSPLDSIRFANAAARIPYASGTVAAVYSSHMIEHLDRREARSFLAEARRVLRPGGVLRLAALDLSRLVDQYLSSGDADAFVGRTRIGLDRPAGRRERARWMLIGPRRHLWMYDGASLARLLRDTGFVDVAVEPPGVTRIVDPGGLDLKELAAESIYVEADRP